MKGVLDFWLISWSINPYF